MSIKAMKQALEALERINTFSVSREHAQLMSEEAITAIREALAQPQPQPIYRRGDRLICLETGEFCVIHIGGTDGQFIKFPDTHVFYYTNEQVSDLFELLQKEVDPADEKNDALLAANKDLQAHFDALMDDYKELSKLCTSQGIRLMDAEDALEQLEPKSVKFNCTVVDDEHPNGVALGQWGRQTEKVQPFCYHDGKNVVGKEFSDHSDVFPLYTAPPRQPWVGLTDEEWETTHWSPDFRAGAKWAEAKLKEKNT